MIRQEIARLIGEAVVRAGYESAPPTVGVPSSPHFGDYSSPIAMSIAKTYQKNPLEVAQAIVAHLGSQPLIEKIECVKPGFINIWVSKQTICDQIGDICTKQSFPIPSRGQKQNVIVEFSSPNIAKPFTVGHLRSTIIGDAIANILSATGYTVFRDNHVGDWGTQFGKLIYAIKAWGNLDEIQTSSRPIKVLVDLYVKFHSEAEIHPEIENDARAWFKKLEDGDTEARALWRKCIDWSWKEFDEIYQTLNISFTENDGRGFGESFFEDKMQAVVDTIRKTLSPLGNYRQSDGAELVFFPDEKLPPFMIIKQDGSTLYSTRDLTTDAFRLRNPRYGPDVWIINEVGIEQSLYFKQLYETEHLLGWVKPGQRTHVKHGLYRFKDTKMSTRKGNTIWLEDVLSEATKRAMDLTNHYLPQENGGELKQTTKPTQNVQEQSTKRTAKQSLSTAEYLENAQIVGIGALKWNDLKRSPHLDIVFDWDEILSMDGNSGPYIQYTIARCVSVRAKAPLDTGAMKKIDPHVLNEQDLAVVRMLIHWPEVLHDAAENLNPSLVCTFLFELGQAYNLFYQKNPILKAPPEVGSMRLAISDAVAIVLRSGLSLLGIKAVEKM